MPIPFLPQLPSNLSINSSGLPSNSPLTSFLPPLPDTNASSSLLSNSFRYIQSAAGESRRQQSYLIGISDSCPTALAAIDTLKPLLAALNIQIQTTFDIMGVRGLRVQFFGPALPLKDLANIPCLSYIEDDVNIYQQNDSDTPQPAFAVTENACLLSPGMQSKQDLWGLDAMDGKMDNTYGLDLTGENVNVYVIDSGIRTDHPEFGGRAQNIYSADSLKNQSQEDCTGHGTHVAGVIGGKTVGMAKRANLFGLRVIDCTRSGSVSDAIDALNFLSTTMKKPAVINLSLGSTDTLRGDTLPRALTALARSGAAIVIAAGNSQKDVCDPAQSLMTTVPNTFVVGALNRPSATDLARHIYEPRMAPFSNRGSCVQFWAPGVDIWSSSNNTADITTSPMAFESRQGTSQAAPFVSGVIALHFGANPNLTPAELQALILRDSIPLPQVSPTARHVVAPRAAKINAMNQFARTQSARLSFPLSQCEASNAGVVAAFTSALSTTRGLLIASICGGIVVLLIVGIVVYIIKRRRASAPRRPSLDPKLSIKTSSSASRSTKPNFSHPPNSVLSPTTSYHPNLIHSPNPSNMVQHANWAQHHYSG